MQNELNQEQIDAMLRAARSGGGAEAGQAQKKEPKVELWDVHRAGQIGREQLQAITQLHEGFARSLTHRNGEAPPDIVFERMEGLGECVRIIGSYSAKVKAEEVRMAQCGEHPWVRLERQREEAVTLVLRVPSASCQLSVLSSRSSVVVQFEFN